MDYSIHGSNYSRENDFETSEGRFWNYSDQFQNINTEGDRRSPPVIGSPTFVWHIALWPKIMPGDREVAFEEQLTSELTQQEVSQIIGKRDNVDPFVNFQTILERYNHENRKFFHEISGFLENLQNRGCVSDAEIQKIELRKPSVREMGVVPGIGKSQSSSYTFDVCDPQSISFTLWWEDEADAGQLNNRHAKPKDTDIRVRVLAQTYLDHATISIYIDVGKIYDGRQILGINDVHGRRRQSILEKLLLIRRSADLHVYSGAVEGELVPEIHITDEISKELFDIGDYFYEGVWREFCQSFDVKIPESVCDKDLVGERFCDLRGVLMQVESVETPLEVETRKGWVAARERSRKSIESKEIFHDDVKLWADEASRKIAETDSASANVGFGNFMQFDENVGEPNTVVKSHWPFIRRVFPYIDYKDLVACTIIDSHALYLTPLGISKDVHIRHEYDVNNEIEQDRFWPSVPLTDLKDVVNEQFFSNQFQDAHNYHVKFGVGEGVSMSPHQLRFLIFTKGEPNRERMGRYLELVVSLTSMRLFVLKNLATVKNANTYLRMLSRALDGTLSRWSRERRLIEDWYSQEQARRIETREVSLQNSKNKRSFEVMSKIRKSVRDREIGRYEINIRVPEDIDLENVRILLLDRVIRKTEDELISLGAALDNVGQGGAGRLLYVIERSRYYAREFLEIYPDLEIKNIPGWHNYTEYVSRDIRPAFEFIDLTGVSLVNVRQRLQDLTNTIQTTALIIEAGATRNNTQTLEEIGITIWDIYKGSFRWGVGLLGMVAILGDFAVRRTGSFLGWVFEALSGGFSSLLQVL